MTVKVLIEKLSQLPGDLDVYSIAVFDFVEDVYVDRIDGKAVVVLE